MSDLFEQSGKSEAHGSGHGPSRDRTNTHTVLIAVLTAGLVVALGTIGYLSNKQTLLSKQIDQMQDTTQGQIAKLSDATTSLLEDRMQKVSEELNTIKGAAANTTAALRQARTQAQKQAEELKNTFEDQQKSTSDLISDLKNSTTSSLAAVTNDVGSVKTDVTGVRSDVTSVKGDVATTQANLDKTNGDLKRAMGDMGVMSGLIATNAKDLAALRALGERNYVEFDITRKDAMKKLGDVTIALKKADPKANRYTVDVLADDRHVEKKDRTINEPVQLYLGGNRLPYEIVVNQVMKDEIKGYLSTPKMTVARN